MRLFQSMNDLKAVELVWERFQPRPEAEWVIMPRISDTSNALEFGPFLKDQLERLTPLPDGWLVMHADQYSGLRKHLHSIMDIETQRDLLVAGVMGNIYGTTILVPMSKKYTIKCAPGLAHILSTSGFECLATIKL